MTSGAGHQQIVHPVPWVSARSPRIKRADVALYQAKRAGGDQYAVSHPARPDRAVS
jgi:hypothetical protein